MPKENVQVDTGKLLEHLQEHTDEHTTTISSRSPAPKRVEPASLADRKLVLVVGDDFLELVRNVVGIGRLATEGAERLSSVVETTFLHIPTRRVGQEEKPKGQDDRPKELKRDRDAVGAGVVAVVGSFVNA